MAELTGKPMEQIVNWFMLLIIFVFDPLAIAMVVAANMAFAQIKSFKPKEDLKKEYKVYKKSEAPKEKVITKEITKTVPVEKVVEKIITKEVPVEKIIEKKVPSEKLPNESKEWIMRAAKHARRAGKEVPPNLDRFFD